MHIDDKLSEQGKPVGRLTQVTFDDFGETHGAVGVDLRKNQADSATEVTCSAP